MSAKSNRKKIVFKTLEEYQAFYRASVSGELPSGSKFYRLGVGIAKMACDEAVHQVKGAERVGSQ